MTEKQDKKPTADEMTTGQSARLLGISIQTVHHWIKAGRLEAREVWLGRKRMRYVTSASAHEMLEELNRLHGKH